MMAEIIQVHGDVISCSILYLQGKYDFITLICKFWRMLDREGELPMNSTKTEPPRNLTMQSIGYIVIYKV